MSTLLTAPAWSDSPHAPQRCQGRSRPLSQLRDQTALSFTGPLRQPGDGVSHPARSNSASWRTKASMYSKIAERSSARVAQVLGAW